MVVFGIVISLAIAFVRDNSALASDTIIGVFFALAVGFGGMMLSALNRSTFLDPEKFLFGSVLFVTEYDLIVLAILLLCVGGLILPTYNANLLSSFNASLARSRGIRVTLWNYLFIVVLALIVNLCLKAVGALLINALLVVPAATAANISRSARGMFWWTLAIAWLAGVGGLWISCAVEIPVRRGEPLPLAPSGTIVVVAVTAFFLSLGSRILRDRLSPPPAA
jgi:zinc transport system permease protein